jgi:hypothetical protein
MKFAHCRLMKKDHFIGMEQIMCEGIADELDGVQFKDKRLADRSKRLIITLSQNPEARINASCDGWSDTQAAYRFFKNTSVTSEAILQSHREVTQRRVSTESVVLFVQDTTELDYSDHPQRDAKEIVLVSPRFFAPSGDDGYSH